MLMCPVPDILEKSLFLYRNPCDRLRHGRDLQDDLASVFLLPTTDPSHCSRRHLLSRGRIVIRNRTCFFVIPRNDQNFRSKRD
jgi:hypothetical protein